MKKLLGWIVAFIAIPFVLSLFPFLPVVELSAEAVEASSAWQWIQAALYFIPVHTVVQILGVILALSLWSLVVSVIKTIWDLLPVV